MWPAPEQTGKNSNLTKMARAVVMLQCGPARTAGISKGIKYSLSPPPAPLRFNAARRESPGSGGSGDQAFTTH